MNVQSDGALDASGGLVTICARALGNGLTARQILSDLERRRVSPRDAREVLTLAEARMALKAGRPLRLTRNPGMLDSVLLVAVGLLAGLLVSWVVAETAQATLGLRIPPTLGSGGSSIGSDLPATLVGAGAGVFVAFWARRFGTGLLVLGGALGAAAFLLLAAWIHI